MAAAFGMFALASLGLTIAGFRPISQTLTETSCLPPNEPASDAALLDPIPVPGSEQPSDYIEPGESRPSLANPRTSSPIAGQLGQSNTEPIAIPKRMKQAQTNQCGTAIDFVRSQSIAFDRAAHEQKLVMVLHVAGNFEDPGFT
jgi:hypothetical protein